MIRKELSKLPDSGSMGRAMNYALEKATLVGGSQAKFEKTSVADFVKLGVKKCDQVNNKYENKSGRKQENVGMHEMISFDATDNITPEQAAELALGVWRDVLDIDNHQHRWGVHTDTDQIHVHLVWNKRDNAGKIYNQKNDYELFEKALHKTEMANGLKVVENRKFLKPDMPTNPQSSNEWRYEKKGKKSEKTLFKEAVAAATDKAMTAGEFLEFLDRDGYTLITNGNNAYSLEKDGKVFKASDVGGSYKALKARFGDDPQFSDTLARLGVKKAPERKLGGISFDMYVTQADLDQYETKKQKSNRVLDTQFDSRNGHDFFFKDTNKKAFEYDAMRGRVEFNSNSPTAIKAGLQKLMENTHKPDNFRLDGSDYAKSQIWLQFHLMGLDKKGHTLSGYSPTQADKFKLEQEQNKFNPDLTNAENTLSKNAHHVHKSTSDMRTENNSAFKLESFTHFKVSETRRQAETPAERAANSGAAGIIEGFVTALCDMTNSFTANMIEDKFSEMRVLDKEIKDKNDEAESQYHQNKKRKKNMPKPQ
ncbi:relaxase/mobilization nuclease domain-containing protein [Pseudomonas aeruginosa]|uniref:relaxase/mobilization nuclease domain-containing protein n=1 Tax=Pseudomonas aeruginosa TaxID=287 RepID=UPI0021AF82CB|nr:relaxase/mobilization nuclease domain-containing protein [Pseudomonas aeruginosa]